MQAGERIRNYLDLAMTQTTAQLGLGSQGGELRVSQWVPGTSGSGPVTPPPYATSLRYTAPLRYATHLRRMIPSRREPLSYP